MRFKTSALILLLLGTILSQCNDPSLIGSDLLKDDEINLKYIDTFKVEATTILDTGVIVYAPLNLHYLNQLPVGNFQDPIFGQTEASIYLQFVRPNIINLNYLNSKLDSIRLYLAFDTLRAPYGKSIDDHDIVVYPMNGNIERFATFKSNNVNFSTSNFPIGSLYGGRPNIYMHVPIVEPGNDTVLYDPLISIPMTESYGESILHIDSLTYNSDSIFLASVNGFLIKQTNPNSRMLNFNLSSGYSRLQFVSKKDTTSSLYSFPFENFAPAIGPRVPSWKHNFSPTILDALNNKIKGGQYIYLQSLAGLKAKIEFPNLKLDAHSIVNKAEMEFTVVELPGDDISVYSPAPQLALYRRDSLGYDYFISDQAGQSTYGFLGGALFTREVNGVIVRSYIFNLSNHVQRILAGVEKSEVYIGIAPTALNQVFPTATTLSRVVLAGPQNADHPVKLKISYTLY